MEGKFPQADRRGADNLRRMKTLAVLFAGELNDYSLEPLSGGSSAFDRSVSTMCRLPGVKRLCILSSRTHLDGYPSPSGEILKARASAVVAGDIVPVFIEESAWTVERLFSRLASESEGFDRVVFAFADQPHMDVAFSENLSELHIRYAAEYAFADGYPQGLAPEYLAQGILPVLARLSKGDTAKVSRGVMFDVIKKDINSFDIETDIAPVDLRHLRILLACDTRQGMLLCEALDGITGGNYADFARERAVSLRTVPNFYAVQVAGRCPFECVFCPYPAFCSSGSGLSKGGSATSRADTMSVADFEALTDKIAVFSETAVVSLSLWGECSYHPDVTALVSSILRHPGLSALIETTGIGWKDEVLESIARVAHDAGPRIDGRRSIDWIVSLDAMTSERYESLRRLPGGENSTSLFQEATSFVDRASQLFPEAVWPQTLRMTANEEELETFYRHWKETLGRVIVQKCDHFCGTISDLRVADLSPLQRHPCWHITRDMSILIDGTVPLCREDLYASRSFGNALSGNLSEIWSGFQSMYEHHVNNSFEGMCGACDEYYTCNF